MVAFQGSAEQETAVVTGLTIASMSASSSAPVYTPEGTALKVGHTVVRINPQFYRPAEFKLLVGDPSHAKAKLGWAPTTSLELLCQIMVEADLRRNACGRSF